MNLRRAALEQDIRSQWQHMSHLGVNFTAEEVKSIFQRSTNIDHNKIEVLDGKPKEKIHGRLGIGNVHIEFIYYEETDKMKLWIF